MAFPKNKTKIVCTIGPASESPEVMKQMMLAGMNVARLNFSHGDFEAHADMIAKIREAARHLDRRIAIMGDLPGPKMRIGQLDVEPIDLKPGGMFTLSGSDITGTEDCASVSFAGLPQVVKPGDLLYLNDGIIELAVVEVKGIDVVCKIMVGGELRSRKGLNLPGINLGISAFTDFDYECLKFAKSQGIEAVSQSFVESAADIVAVRTAATDLDYHPFIIAKIERSRTLDHMDDILAAADGIMIARGDLGVEIPIEQIAVVQKGLMRQANLLGKPVITATQMLESMTTNRRPTRAEATDVANAILDGTDGVMLSGESALGAYPVDAVRMLAAIAAATEAKRPPFRLKSALNHNRQSQNLRLPDIIALSVETALRHVTPPTIIVPTHSGATARSIARFRPPVWITATSSQENTCQNLLFSYGVFPVYQSDHPSNWRQWAADYLKSIGMEGDLVILTEGPSAKYPHRSDRMEIVDLTRE
jgi:pyruvate kinase